MTWCDCEVLGVGGVGYGIWEIWCLLLTTKYCIQLHRTTVVVSTIDVMLITSSIRILREVRQEQVSSRSFYTQVIPGDAELDAMADRNSKRSPPTHRVNMGLARTKSLKVITHWVRKKIHEGSPCDLRSLLHS